MHRHTIAILASLLGCLAGTLPAEAAGASPAFPSPDRLNVLFISPPHGYNGDAAAECTLLESLCNVRFTNAMTPSNGGDQVADVDAHFGADDRWVPLRKAEILRQLHRPYDAVLLATGANDPDIGRMLSDYVTNGGTLILLGGVALPEPLATTWKAASVAPTSPAVSPLSGLGLEQAGMQPEKGAKLLTGNVAVLHPGVAAYGASGKGRILSLPSLCPVHFTVGVDGDWLWAQAFERLVRFAVRGTAAPSVLVTAAPVEGKTGSVTERKYTVTLTGPRDVTVCLQQSDMRGGVRELAKAVKLTGEPMTTEVTVSVANAPLLMIQALPTAGTVAGGMTFVKVPAPLGLDLYVTRQGNVPDFATQSTLQLDPKIDLGKAILHWTVLDWARRTVAYRAEPLELHTGNKVEKTFDYTLGDPDARAYIYWLQASVTDDAGRMLARGETKLYRYRPYASNEQLLMGTWHTDTVSGRPGIADQFAAYLRGCGFNAVFSFADQNVMERYNFRQYMEHQGTTRVGVGHAAPFSAGIDGYAQRYQAEGRMRSGIGDTGKPGYRGPWPSAALNLFSMGEETGFGSWSESYPWRKQEAAPEECNKWFRYYLQQLYGNDLGKLNTAWERNFTDWSEIKVWRKYAQPYGWMFMPPPQDLEPNLTPYVDTHAFHEWYVRQYCENYMKGYATGNPVTTWTMSYDFTFLQYSPMPMTNFWHALAPEGVALWHNYIRSRTPGHGNPFHLDWMFFEDEPMNNQFLQLGLASGCTYLFNWGPMFNGDLTPSRKTLAVAKTMQQAERPEAILRTMTPHTDARIGIYTLDSRWALVRGRYGFFLQPNGPNDVSMGKGPYQAPGASYVKPPELPLYTALTASGYAPKYVRPEEFKDCKVLFMPYVEAIDAETAAKVEQYVRDGGTLIVFPTIAQYDAGGKPYPQYPGAGFDKLLGFTADPAWLMGRAQVDFPGENAAKKAFDDAWRLGEQTKDVSARPQGTPLYFNMAMRIGGHPCYYMPEGRQRLTNLQKDVVVIGRHEDGNPLFTYRQVGKGAAICFNVLLTGESGLAQTVTEATETFREAIDQLVRRCGVTPDVEFFNTRSYGEGISDFVTTQYDVPGAETRILTLFTDWRGRRADARLRLRAPFTTVYDVLTGEKLVTIMNEAAAGRDMSFATGNLGEKGTAPETVVVVEPGYWRVLALTTTPIPAPTLTGPQTATLGETAAFQVGPDPKATRYGRVEVVGPDGNVLAHHSAGVVLQPGEPLRLRLRLDDPLTTAAGKAAPWTIRYRDAITGQRAETTLAVRAGADSTALARAALPGDGESLSRQGARRGPEISDTEFLGLLSQLRAHHLDPKPVDKRTYSYYSYELGDSRHRIMQLLACVDWTTRVKALVDFLATGERLYLVCEDLGYDAASGVTTTPGRNPRILEALQQLAGYKGAAVLAVSGKPYLRVVQVGKGLLVLDRRSPDGAGNSNLHLAAFQQAWRQEMERAGLVPGGSGTRFLPISGETLTEWFFAK